MGRSDRAYLSFDRAGYWLEDLAGLAATENLRNKAVILDDGTLRETLRVFVFCMSIFCGRKPAREFLRFPNPKLTT